MIIIINRVYNLSQTKAQKLISHLQIHENPLVVSLTCPVAPADNLNTSGSSGGGSQFSIINWTTRDDSLDHVS